MKQWKLTRIYFNNRRRCRDPSSTTDADRRTVMYAMRACVDWTHDHYILLNRKRKSSLNLTIENDRTHEHYDFGSASCHVRLRHIVSCYAALHPAHLNITFIVLISDQEKE